MLCLAACTARPPLGDCRKVGVCACLTVQDARPPVPTQIEWETWIHTFDRLSDHVCPQKTGHTPQLLYPCDLHLPHTSSCFWQVWATFKMAVSPHWPRYFMGEGGKWGGVWSSSTGACQNPLLILGQCGSCDSTPASVNSAVVAVV